MTIILLHGSICNHGSTMLQLNPLQYPGPTLIEVWREGLRLKWLYGYVSMLCHKYCSKPF